MFSVTTSVVTSVATSVLTNSSVSSGVNSSTLISKSVVWIIWSNTLNSTPNSVLLIFSFSFCVFSSIWFAILGKVESKQ